MTDRLASLRGGAPLSNFSSQAYDLEGGIDDESNKLLKKFNEEVDAIEKVIKWAEERIAVSQSTKAARTKQLEVVEEKVFSLRPRLRTLADGNKLFANEHSNRPATVRTRIVRYTKCTNDFIAVTGTLSTAWEEHRRDLATDVKRDVMNANPRLLERDVDTAIRSGEQAQLELVLSYSGTNAERHQLEDIRQRNKELQKLAQGVAELNHMFQDMSILVETQQELINNVEFVQQEVVEDTHMATEQLEQAHASQKSARKKKMWCIILLVLIVAIIILAIILSVVL